jgi:hypothetical protein
MKKLVAFFIIGLSLSVTAVFAEHPDGLGIGVMGNFGYNGSALGGPAVSLKIPSVPIFWGARFGFGTHYFGLGVTGDYYFIDKTLAEEIKLGWYLGAGGFLGMGFYNWDESNPTWKYHYSYNNINLGVRVPIGLSWQPFKFFEVFMDVAPALGLGINIDSSTRETTNGVKDNNWKSEYTGARLYWDVGFTLGARFWI